MNQLCFGLIGVLAILAVYMLIAHQRIQWERDRGLLVRQSFGLYWSVRNFFKRYVKLLTFTLILVIGVGGFLCYLKKQSQSGPTMGNVISEKTLSYAQQEESKGENVFLELKEWVARLEVRRREHPENYCDSVYRGLETYRAETSPSLLVKAKLSYLEREHAGQCPNSESAAIAK